MSFLPLPNEILVSIFGLLPFDDLRSCRLVARQFNDVISANSRRMRKIPLRSLNLKAFTLDSSLGDQNNEGLDLSFGADHTEHIRVKVKGSAATLCFCYYDKEDKVASTLLKYFLNRGCYKKIIRNREQTSDFKIKLRYNISNTRDEMKTILDFTFKTYEIEMMGTEISDNLNDHIMSCLRESSARYLACAPMYITDNLNETIPFYQALKSPIVVTPFLDSDILFLDTTHRLTFRKNSLLSTESILTLITEWSNGQRNIKHLTASKSDNHGYMWKMKVASIKSFAKQFHRMEICQETENSVDLNIHRVSDDKVLHISYSKTTEEKSSFHGRMTVTNTKTLVVYEM